MGDGDQQLVADGRPEAVGDEVKSVERKQQQGEAAPRFCLPPVPQGGAAGLFVLAVPEGIGESGQQQAAVGKTGETVAQQLFLDHRTKHLARRCGTDDPSQLGLAVMRKFGVDRLQVLQVVAPGIVGKRLFGIPCAKKSCHQRLQVRQ